MEAVYSNEDNSRINMTVDGITSNVPNSMGNRDRRTIKKWEEAGNTIGVYVAPPVDESE